MLFELYLTVLKCAVLCWWSSRTAPPLPTPSSMEVGAPWSTLAQEVGRRKVRERRREDSRGAGMAVVTVKITFITDQCDV